MTGCIFSIEEFSVYDGPGIRTTVFLKGCPLRCSWCHNPEGQEMRAQIVRSPNGCVGCKRCEQAATVEDGKLVFTQQSIQNCPMHLLRVCGDEMSPEALCDRLLKNRRLLQKGGVTFSGGEPFSQKDFLFACLRLLKGKLHTAIQTSGYCSAETFARALELADYFLFDLKVINEDGHKLHTGVSNRNILDNFSALAKSGKEFTVRVPLIPGVTDTRENMEDIARVLNDNGVHYVELLPYNKMAGGKYALVQRQYTPTFDEQQEVVIRKEILDAHGIEYKVL